MAENPEEEKKDELPRYPRLKIQAINKEAAQFFEAANNLEKNSPQARKLRRQGLDFLQQQAENYVIENDLDPERLNELKTSELVFLFSNLAKSKKPEITSKKMFIALWNECDERIAQAEENKWEVPDKECAALIKFCRVAPKLVHYSNFSEECLNSLIPWYEKWRILLEEAAAAKKEAAKKESTHQQKVEVNEVVPTVDTNAPARPKDYGSNLALRFKKIAPAYGIRYKRVDKKEDDFIRYDLYPWKKLEENQPTGSLTIHDDKKITLASQEYEHFIATVKMLKDAGHDEIVLKELSKDPEEAKTFAANMVVAGHIADIKVQQPFKLEELQKYNPRISGIIQQQKPNNAQPITQLVKTR